ncbi:MAG: conserved phage C-terminal domain-containing protein [Deltaproteobacteria bacterium]|nr:conserved phage C-terminal domain-containing protein [Deltaproteobacteria bacterium]
MEKRNYWLKLKEDFFSQPYVKKLRKIAGGDTYTIIYQKILLISVKTDGYIIFQGIEKNLTEELALILDEDVDNVTVTLEFMKANKLIEQTGNKNENEYLLPDMLSLIGSEGESAKWVRAYRKKKRQSLILSTNFNNIQKDENNKTLHCKADVRKCKENVIIDIDIDKDIDKEKEKEIIKEKEKSDPPFPPRGELPLNEKAVEVLDYLNLKTNKKFTAKNKANLNNIRARLKEGFSIDQLKCVIDKKTAEWLNDGKMNQYLNPETLFRPKKFEIYLNSKPPGTPSTQGGREAENKYVDIKTTHIDNVTGEMWVTGG